MLAYLSGIACLFPKIKFFVNIIHIFHHAYIANQYPFSRLSFKPQPILLQLSVLVDIFSKNIHTKFLIYMLILDLTS